ncbi:MAG TPA: TlpA disulfide reductase family protein [Nevskiaceae bacterium]|nr:TlpA disulfide reductase family protein [Nevskiaceae bacterium]
MTFRLACTVLAALASASAHAVVIDQPAPEISGKSIVDGKPLKLSAFKGKVVYLDIWASWCAPCRVSLPELQKMHQELAPLGVEVVGLDVDEEAAHAQKLMTDAGVTYPVIRDVDAKTITRYEIMKMPAAYLIDRDGVVRYSYQGFSLKGFESIRPMVEELARTGKIADRDKR